MIYEVRHGALGKPSVWRLEEGVLVEEGWRNGRYPLSQLKTARLTRNANRLGAGERVLVLAFGRRRLAIGSMSYAGLGQRTDQSEAFAPFVRAVLAQAVALAPNARFRLPPDLRLGLYGWVLAIVAAGLVLTLIATLAAGSPALGADLGARIGFVLILMLTPLPWVHGLGGHNFDPLNIPFELLG